MKEEYFKKKGCDILLLTTGRRLYMRKTDEERTIHHFKDATNQETQEIEVSHNHFLSWMEAMKADNETVWKKRLLERKFEEKYAVKYMDFLKKHHLIMELDLKTAAPEELLVVLVTRNAFSFVFEEGEADGQHVGVISTINLELKVKLTEEQYWVLTAATSDSLLHVLERVKQFLECDEEKARELMDKYIKTFIDKGLWTLEYIGAGTPSMTHISKKTMERRKIGFPVGIIKTKQQTYSAVLTTENLVLLQHIEDYQNWMRGESENIQQEELVSSIFAYNDESVLFACPQGHFVKHDAEKDEYLLKPFFAANAIPVPRLFFTLWNMIHAYAPLSYIREVLELSGLEKEEIDEVLMDVINALTNLGLATLVKR